MADVRLLVAELRKKGVAFTVEGNTLKWEVLYGDDLAEYDEKKIVAHTEEVIRLLNEEADRDYSKQLEEMDRRSTEAWLRQGRRRNRILSILFLILGTLVIFVGLWVIGGPWLAVGVSIVLVGTLILLRAFH